MKLTKEYVAQIPVWLKLFNVPMEYWDFEGLSRIASHIGVPLFMDHLTSSGTRISFARVCVEVNVDSILPHSFFVKCEDEVVEIRVEYQDMQDQPNLSLQSTVIVEPSQLAPPPQRESRIPGVNQEAPLKELHDEILGLAQVLSPRAS
ncbi:hypothetical protein ACSBR2_004317 [Camellia fascicularis]